MRALTMRTIVKRPEAGTQAKPRAVDVLHEGLAGVQKPAMASHSIRGSKSPRAFLDSHSMWKRCYYTKLRVARGFGARSAEAAICGMRWNYFLSFGKNIHLAAGEERHTGAITNGLLRNATHNTATENNNDAYEYRHAIAAQAAGSTHAATHAMQSAPACGQMAQAAAGGAWAAAENPGEGHAAHPSSSDAGTAPQIIFSISVFLPASIHHETAGSHHWHGAPEAAGQAIGHETRQPHNHEISQAAPTHAIHLPSFSALSLPCVQPDAGTPARQMDVSLAISYNPLSQLSYMPTYQVGIDISAVAVPQPATGAAAVRESWAVQGAAEATSATWPLQAAAAIAQPETAIGSLPKKQFMLKVAHADAVPE